MDAATVCENVLASIEDHHDRGDEVVHVVDIAYATGINAIRVRAMMDALVCNDELACRFPDYWIEGYNNQEVK
jgi:hypothetical protein